MRRAKVVAIIQARMGSTRLPGKVLMDLHGRTMLERVVGRTRRASLIDEVVVATTSHESDEPIIDECRRLDVPYFLGSEDDVLDRYNRAADAHHADVIVRITSDCPLIDPTETDRVVRAFLDSHADYASNFIRRTYPRGLDTEAMSAATLAHAWLEAGEPYERIHVTPYIYGHPEMFQLLSVTGREDHSNYRWTVDTPEDLQFVREIYRLLGTRETAGWREVLSLLRANPKLAEINQSVRHKELVEG
ncbi:MAG: glycosyltransferase family protein [Pirellulales bacterium]|nr:glycosyltransferase family protein [Pirellulales bacterium]